MHGSEALKQLRITSKARTDLVEIGRYTESHWGAAQKVKYWQEIMACIRQLRDMPGLGVARMELHKDQRSHPVGKHIVYYRDTGDLLIIDRILHQSMEPLIHFGGQTP